MLKPSMKLISRAVPRLSFDCPEWHALQTYNGGDKVGHIPLIRTYANNGQIALDAVQKALR